MLYSFALFPFCVAASLALTAEVENRDINRWTSSVRLQRSLQERDTQVSTFDATSKNNNKQIINGTAGSITCVTCETSGSIVISSTTTTPDADLLSAAQGIVSSVGNLLKDPAQAIKDDAAAVAKAATVLIDVDFKEVQAEFLLGVSSNGSLSQTFQLFSPPTPLGVSLTPSQTLGLVILFDLVLGISGAVDLTGGFTLAFPKTAQLSLNTLTGEIMSTDFGGASVNGLPVTVNSGSATLTAALKVTVQIGTTLNVLGAGVSAEAGLFVNLPQYTAVLNSSTLCELSLSETLDIDVGAFAQLAGSVDFASFAIPSASATTTLAVLTLPGVCATKGTKATATAKAAAKATVTSSAVVKGGAKNKSDTAKATAAKTMDSVCPSLAVETITVTPAATLETKSSKATKSEKDTIKEVSKTKSSKESSKTEAVQEHTSKVKNYEKTESVTKSTKSKDSSKTKSSKDSSKSESSKEKSSKSKNNDKTTAVHEMTTKTVTTTVTEVYTVTSCSKNQHCSTNSAGVIHATRTNTKTICKTVEKDKTTKAHATTVVIRTSTIVHHASQTKNVEITTKKSEKAMEHEKTTIINKSFITEIHSSVAQQTLTHVSIITEIHSTSAILSPVIVLPSKTVTLQSFLTEVHSATTTPVAVAVTQSQILKTSSVTLALQANSTTPGTAKFTGAAVARVDAQWAPWTVGLTFAAMGAVLGL